MFMPAFSTVACPEWPLERVLSAAGKWGYERVELRTFGDESTGFASDPALTGANKVRSLVREAGVEIACAATDLRFDDPIRPPVIGLVIGDQEREVRRAKDAIDLASSIECPLVRVFAFEFGSERRSSAIRRIAARLAMVADHARNTGVRIALENGGSFPTAALLCGILDEVNNPLLGVSYSMSVAHAAGEDPVRGINVLGDRLWLARIRDLRRGRPCAIGDGDLPCRAFAAALAASGFGGPLVVEWDRAWVPGLAEPENALPGAIERLYSWAGEAAPA